MRTIDAHKNGSLIQSLYIENNCGVTVFAPYGVDEVHGDPSIVKSYLNETSKFELINEDDPQGVEIFLEDRDLTKREEHTYLLLEKKINYDNQDLFLTVQRYDRNGQLCLILFDESGEEWDVVTSCVDKKLEKNVIALKDHRCGGCSVFGALCRANIIEGIVDQSDDLLFCKLVDGIVYDGE